MGTYAQTAKTAAIAARGHCKGLLNHKLQVLCKHYIRVKLEADAKTWQHCQISNGIRLDISICNSNSNACPAAATALQQLCANQLQHMQTAAVV